MVLRNDDCEIFEDCVVKKVTQKACLLAIEDNEYWVPKSVIDEEESDIIEQDNVGTFYIQRWFVEKECIE